MIDTYKKLIYELVEESQDELFMQQIYTILIRRKRKGLLHQPAKTETQETT